MPAYHFVAIAANSKEQKGVIEADSEKHARQLLRDKTLIPIRVKATSTKKVVGKPTKTAFFNKKKLSAREIALTTRQIATLLSAGLPVEECLQAVSEQSEKQAVKSLLLSVRSKVTEGHALASAMRDHPEAFSPLYCSTIAAGEKTGHLDKVLLRLADYTEQQARMQQKLRTAMIYPSMIVFVAICIVGFLLEYVVPKMVSVYGHMKQALPAMTQFLISLSNNVKSYGFYGVMTMIAFIVIWRMMLKRSQNLREKVHRLLLRAPFFGYSLKTADTARFARTLSILSASGVPALEAMAISAQLITTIPIRKAVEQAVSKVREGTTIHIALKQTSYFSPMCIHMVASGEASGQLESMLERVALNQEEEIIRLIDTILAMFEPAIILIMGGIVLFIVLAVLMPIFDLNQFTG